MNNRSTSKTDGHVDTTKCSVSRTCVVNVVVTTATQLRPCDFRVTPIRSTFAVASQIHCITEERDQQYSKCHWDSNTSYTCKRTQVADEQLYAAVSASFVGVRLLWTMSAPPHHANVRWLCNYRPAAAALYALATRVKRYPLREPLCGSICPSDAINHRSSNARKW